jgi:DNA invertase Pin-like site-specific DNA recombinase
MLRILEDGSVQIVLGEKTDRLYRNRTDALSFEELIEKGVLKSIWSRNRA